jgi:hypothetical protein
MVFVFIAEPEGVFFAGREGFWRGHEKQGFLCGQ